MHCASFEAVAASQPQPQRADGGDVLVALAALVTEGRIPGKSCGAPGAPSGRGFFEGPHCCNVLRTNGEQQHACTQSDDLCKKYEQMRTEVLSLWQRRIPLCVDVLLASKCENRACSGAADVQEDEHRTSQEGDDNESVILLEKWFITRLQNRSPEMCTFNVTQLINAIRSQLHFSQISAWLSSQDGDAHQSQQRLKISAHNLKYNVTIPGETYERCKFTCEAVAHEFPLADIGNGQQVKVTLKSLPRMPPPLLTCPRCTQPASAVGGTCAGDVDVDEVGLLDDRMHLSCTLNGKHRCEDVDEFELRKERIGLYKRVCCHGQHADGKSEKRHSCAANAGEECAKAPKLDLKSGRDLSRASDVFRQAILRSCRLQEPLEAVASACSTSTSGSGSLLAKCDVKCVQKLGELGKLGTSILSGCAKALQSVSDINNSDRSTNKRDIESSCSSSSMHKKVPVYADEQAHRNPAQQAAHFESKLKMRDISNAANAQGSSMIDIPSPNEQAKFRKSLDNAASMVFHSRTGLPLTSSPAPMRRGNFCFDFDSSINTVSDIKSALFPANLSTDDDSESDGSIVSPCSTETYVYPKKQPSPVKHYRRSNTSLLGSFEESVLNGRLEPVSTVHGFKAELGASGAFVPRHLVVPVTVFFYTLGDNDKVSSPYLGHINLGKKGYMVPKTGTVQVTLFNPLGTVVKMFVIMYDLSDMPPNSQTFIRQRTLYMPTKCHEPNIEWGPKWLRYLIHLRFLSSKSGRIYLHSDVRMIIFRKADMDTATAHGIDMCYELRSFTHMPSQPKYSPRK